MALHRTLLFAVLTLFTLLPTGLLAAAPTVWRFPDENAEALRSAVAAAKLPDQLVTPAEIDAFLKGVKAPPGLGCLADQGSCADGDRAMLGTLGLAGRMEATATVDASGAHVLFLFTPVEAGATERTVRGAGADLPAAVAAALADMNGQATLLVEADPPDVALTLDGKPLGTGKGPFYIPPGEHVVGASKVDRVPGETSITVKAGDTATVRFQLPQTETKVRLDFTPADAKVKVDSEPFAEAPGLFTIAPGKHVFRFEAPGHKPEERVLDIVAGTTGELILELKNTEGSFWSRLKERHPDVGHHPFYVRGGLRTALLLEGPVNAGKSGHRTSEAQQDTELAGVDLGLGWRGKWVTADLGFGYLGGGDRIDAEVGGSPGYMDELRRLAIRPAIGTHLVFWRFEPYLNLGAAINFESFKADKALEVEKAAQRPAELDQTLAAFMMELGLRVQANDNFEAGLAGTLEAGPDQRTAVAFLLQAGYCFALGGQ